MKRTVILILAALSAAAGVAFAAPEQSEYNPMPFHMGDNCDHVQPGAAPTAAFW